MAIVDITLSKEAYVNENIPDNSYPDFAVALVSTSGDENRRALLEFDLSALLDVPNAFISTAVLHVNVLIATNVRLKDFRRIDNDTWVDSTVTWNNQPSSSDYNVEATWSSTGNNSVSIKSMLLNAINDGHNYLGILYKFIDESSDGDLHQCETSSNAYIRITYNTYSQTRLKGSLCKNLLDKSGWGEITMTNHNCPSPCDAATFTFKTAWGSIYTTVLLDVGDTQQYDSGTMHHSFKLYSMTTTSAPCDNLAAATIEEKYWEDDCYVKTTGDNDRNGTDWTEAWLTVNQAANETFDGQEVHIGFGTYDSEPANNDITPVNFGTTGIKYTPETAGTGGGTGIVTVERN